MIQNDQKTKDLAQKENPNTAKQSTRSSVKQQYVTKLLSLLDKTIANAKYIKRQWKHVRVSSTIQQHVMGLHTIIMWTLNNTNIMALNNVKFFPFNITEHDMAAIIESSGQTNDLLHCNGFLEEQLPSESASHQQYAEID